MTSDPSAEIDSASGASSGRTPRASTVLKKREILAAAARAFRRKGLAATGMRDISEEAGMQVGNLYYYFENKEALLAFCQLDALTGLQELGRWVEEQELGASGRLYLLVLGHVLRLNEGTPGSLAHLEVEALGAEWRARLQQERDAYEAVFRQVIRDGIASGELRETDASVAARAILGAVNWTVKWYRPEGERSAREIGEIFAEQMVRGLLAPDVAFEKPAVSLPGSS